MSFPTIQFKTTNTPADPSLQEHAAAKLATLEKFIAGATDATCQVEFEKVASHQSGTIYRVEANLYANGELYRAEATRDSFMNAIDAVEAELDKELRRQNDKRDTLLKRGGRKIKEMLRFGK
jgi:ribosomal subunit interface protein